MLIDFDNYEIIDLSLPIDENVDLEPLPVKIEHLDHKKGISKLNNAILFNKKLPFFKKMNYIFNYLFNNRRFRKEDFPDNEFISNENVFCSVHTGTHVDAPYHFGTKCMNKNAKTIAELDLKFFIGNGVVLDLSGIKPGTTILKKDIIVACENISHQICQGDIVLIKTNASKLWNKAEYFFKFPGMSKEATAYLVNLGVKLIGIDALGFDRPYHIMINEFFRTHDKNLLWPSHFFGREKEYYHIERLANLDAIPVSKNFIFCGFPIKILNVGASWIRAVALINKKRS